MLDAPHLEQGIVGDYSEQWVLSIKFSLHIIIIIIICNIYMINKHPYFTLIICIGVLY